MNTPITKIVYDLDATQYHASAGLSKSLLGHLLKSPAHLKAHLSAEKEEPTKDMLLGTAIHEATLEPEKFLKNWAVLPVGLDRRTTAGKAAYADFVAANTGKNLLSAEDYQTAVSVAASLKDKMGFAGSLRSGTPEISLYAPADNGLQMKARLDLFDPERNIIWDIKTTVAADPFGWRKEVFKYNYALQASHYLDLARRTGLGNDKTVFAFAAVEKVAPYAVGLYTIKAETILKWDSIRRGLLAQWEKAENIGIWPCYSSELIEIEA
jgi:hypothetical protein